MSRQVVGFGFLGLIFYTLSVSAADPFVGKFVGQLDGEEYQLIVNSDSPGKYDGELLSGGARFPLVARRHGDVMRGFIGMDDEGFEFTARIQGAALAVEDQDGERVMFHRDDGAGNTSSTGSSPVGQAVTGRQVYINRVRLDAQTLEALEYSSQVPIADGRYWYDVNCGAWGVEDGPTAGFIYPGLALPSPMPADISGGGTGIFINGREIHPLDQQALHQLFGVTYQGQFWMDAQGNIGYLGGPPIANVLQASQAASSGGGGSVSHGYNSTYGARGTAGGGMYSGRTATGKSVFWYPGM